MQAHRVATTGEIQPGEVKIVKVSTQEIGIFNQDGRYYAIQNHCPHQGAPLCRGSVGGTTMPGPPGTYRWRTQPVIRCPWHKWEFDLESGQALFDARRRVKTYKVEVDGGDVILWI